MFLDSATRALRYWAEKKLRDIRVQIYEAVTSDVLFNEEWREVPYQITLEDQLEDEANAYIYGLSSSGGRSRKSSREPSSIISRASNIGYCAKEPSVQKPAVFTGKVETLKIFLSQVRNVFHLWLSRFTTELVTIGYTAALFMEEPAQWWLLNKERIMTSPDYGCHDFAEELTTI
ncbi:hypothetical protein RUND412_002853 [Rhizina undulata]